MSIPKENTHQKIKFTKKHFNKNKIFESEMFRYISTLDKNKLTKNEKQLINALKQTLWEVEFIRIKHEKVLKSIQEAIYGKRNGK